MSYWGAHQDHWAWDYAPWGQQWDYAPWPPASTAPQGRGKGVGGGAPPTGKRGGKGAGKGAGKEVPEGLAKNWSDKFPLGHYLEAYWPVTIKAYPSQGQPHSWKAIEELADHYSCRVKLGGRQTEKRKNRASVARLSVKGVHVMDCFYAIVRESRRAFGGKEHPKFNSRTVVVHTHGDYDIDGMLVNERTMAGEPGSPVPSDSDTSAPSCDNDSDDSRPAG